MNEKKDTLVNWDDNYIGNSRSSYFLSAPIPDSMAVIFPYALLLHSLTLLCLLSLPDIERSYSARSCSSYRYIGNPDRWLLRDPGYPHRSELVYRYRDRLGPAELHRYDRPGKIYRG